jgi:purine-binding chemotaxis protein CheW
MEQLFFFSVGGIRCGLPVNNIISMIQIVKISHITGNKPWIVGNINFHGKVLPVYSFKILFGLYERPPILSDRLIIAKKDQEIIAISVDESCIFQEEDKDKSYSDISSFLTADIPGIKISEQKMVIIYDLSEFLNHGIDSGKRIINLVLNSDSVNSKPVINCDIQDCSEIEKILKERAIRLSLPDEPNIKPSFIEVIRFCLMSREYAVEMKYIREVIKTRQIAPVPGTPDYIAGICSVRGEIISLVDLRLILSIKDEGLSDMSQVIVLHNGDTIFGILADRVLGIDMIKSDDETGLHQGRELLIKKVITKDNESLDILNVQALFKDPRMVIDDLEY